MGSGRHRMISYCSGAGKVPELGAKVRFKQWRRVRQMLIVLHSASHVKAKALLTAHELECWQVGSYPRSEISSCSLSDQACCISSKRIFNLHELRLRLRGHQAHIVRSTLPRYCFRFCNGEFRIQKAKNASALAARQHSRKVVSRGSVISV